MTKASIKKPGISNNNDEYNLWKKQLNSEIYTNLYSLNRNRQTSNKLQTCQRNLDTGNIQCSSWNLGKLKNNELTESLLPIVQEEIESENKSSREKIRLRNIKSCYPVWNKENKNPDEIWNQISNQIQSPNCRTMCEINIKKYINIQKHKTDIIHKIRNEYILPEFKTFYENSDSNDKIPGINYSSENQKKSIECFPPPKSIMNYFSLCVNEII